MLLQSLEQLRGLLQAALPDAQVRQADDRGVAPRRDAPVEVPGGLHELDLRLVPASGGRQDAAVVGAAEGGDHVAPPRAVGGRAHPLVGAWDVVDQLARPEEPAEDLIDRGELREFTGAERRQRLVAEDHSFLDAIGHHQHATEIRQRHVFDIAIAEAPTDRDRLVEQGLTHLRVRFREGLDDEHPAVLGPALARFLEDAARSRQPTVPDGPITEDVAGDPGGGSRRPARGHVLAFPPVGGVGTLVVRSRGDVVALQVQGLGKALEHLTRLDLGQGEFERTASGCGVAIAQGRRAFFDQRRAHGPMMARPGGLLDRPKA
jgi:hypothetical protein